MFCYYHINDSIMIDSSISFMSISFNRSERRGEIIDLTASFGSLGILSLQSTLFTI